LAKPTISQINDQARALLADTVNGGEIFDDTTLQPFVAQSIRELFRVLRGAQDPFVLVENYFVLPGNVSVVDPASVGINNLAELEYVEWTPSNSSTAITNCVVTLTGAGAPYATVTAAGHGMTIGTLPTVAVYGIVGFDLFNSPNGAWASQVIDANTIQLNGCTATGSYVSGGIVAPVSLTLQFVPMDPRDRIEFVADSPAVPDQTDQVYAWEGGIFRFFPSSQTRLIRITYRTSGVVNPASSAVIPVDDSLDFLAVRAAGLAALSHGADSRGTQLANEALGPTLQADGSGGILGTMLRASIRSLQRIQYRRPPFRARRNRPDFLQF